MEPRERSNEERTCPPSTPGGPSGGGNLGQLSHEASSLLAAGSAIISAALSGNSQAFLAANRQQGGE